MGFEDLIEVSGTLTAVSFCLAIGNYFVKYIYRHFVSRMSKSHPAVGTAYRKVMKLTAKTHKPIGVIAVLSMILHSYSAYTDSGICITGEIASFLLLILFLHCILGLLRKNKFGGSWLMVHRTLSLFTVIAIVVHLMTGSD